MRATKSVCICAAAVLMAGLFAGCGSSNGEVKQTASAKQVVSEDQEAYMTVDLTGGYSVEFATGAAYFYKGEATDENDVAAFGYVISKEEYDEEIAYLKGNEETQGELKDLGNGVYSYDGDYFFPSEDGFFMKVSVQEDAMSEAESIYPRFTAGSTDI